ncbi:glycosyltransferase family 2 protein [Shewanella psychropiezotolerans]|uniref:Glycosyltransferase family 2 protein n=1 Tax=Shewanella psychropiezotolerans TaxID=2593655 RepID=A0ABX5X3Z6_9GAMM|nr:MULTISPECIES: glycosyltransferase family 2 protein [Shewanella]MCJ8344483.1 glycosyltransferase family 2 protein [bacterium]MPY24616.1 glycosyltransferase family 2 protein [Shewanella sp. YLB-07]QDO83961.1 glycosyltransferase family 2 protein [Shewanella psychropiezotolerans]
MISIICPMYNEEGALRLFFKTLLSVLSKQSNSFEIICIDDGCTDATLEELIKIKQKVKQIRIVSFSRNFGKEAALTAGFMLARGDAVIPIDADLQDPPELILTMLEQWHLGYKVVLAKRVDRSSDSFLKRSTANFFYTIHNQLASEKIPFNVGDFRLMDRIVVDAINLLPERQRFMKGLLSWVGFKSITIPYTRECRCNGESKFKLMQLWNLAIEGITSFSTIPLKIWSYIGASISLISFAYGSFIIIRTLVFGIEVPGYASLLVVVLFLGGTQLIGIGVLGEYISRVYLETKHRPLYIIEREY